MKDIPPLLFFKIALGNKKIEDISQIFIIWYYKAGYGDLLSFPLIPYFTFELDENDPRYSKISGKLYPFNILDKDGCNYELSIEIFTVTFVENSEEEDLINSFSLH